jgi:DNA segregation ATPase FtsK/SpoIIIE, S-DNA-T family
MNELLFIVFYFCLAWVVKVFTASSQEISSLKSLMDELSKTRLEVKKIQQQIPDDKNKLSTAQKSKENHAVEGIDNLKKDLVTDLVFLKATTQAAQELATNECPLLLKQEWQAQERFLLNLMDQLDTSISKEAHFRLLSSSWSDIRWNPSAAHLDNYYPQTTGLAPGVLRIGEIIIERELEQACIPALVPIRNLSSDSVNFLPGHIIIFSNDAESRQAAISVIESIALRVISTFPVQKMQGLFIDKLIHAMRIFESNSIN